MNDSAARAVRSKRDSSLRVASRLVRDGCAQGFVSAGNTGAVMATAKMVQGMVPGVDRPALSGVFPSASGSPVVIVDVGANVDCSPQMLAILRPAAVEPVKAILSTPAWRTRCSPTSRPAGTMLTTASQEESTGWVSDGRLGWSYFRDGQTYVER